MVTMQRISPCLWFADEAEEAARFYTGIFKNSRITAITRYGTAGFEAHHRPAGSVMVVAFEYGHGGSAGAQRAMEAMLGLKKLDIAALRRAHAGTA